MSRNLGKASPKIVFLVSYIVVDPAHADWYEQNVPQFGNKCWCLRKENPKGVLNYYGYESESNPSIAGTHPQANDLQLPGPPIKNTLPFAFPEAKYATSRTRQAADVLPLGSSADLALNQLQGESSHYLLEGLRLRPLEVFASRKRKWSPMTHLHKPTLQSALPQIDTEPNKPPCPRGAPPFLFFRGSLF